MIPDSADAIIEFVSRKREVTVRYGRARITIARWGQLGEGPMWAAIRSFRAGELSAEELCWTYVRRRVLSHTPSFDWDNADLDRLLYLVTQSSEEPALPTLSPLEFAPVFAATGEEERAQREESVKRLMESVRPHFEKLGVIGDVVRPAWQKNLAEVAKAQGLFGSTDLFETAKTAIFGVTGVQGPTTFGVGAFAAGMPTADDRLELIRGVLPPGHAEMAKGVANTVAGISGTLGATYGVDGKLLSDHIRSLNFGMKLGSNPAMNALRGHVVEQSTLVLGASVGFEGLLPDVNLLREMRWIGGQIADANRWRDIGNKWIEFFDRVLPRNWRELDGDQTMQAGELMKETGIGLAWAPRKEIVLELIAATDHAERCRILETRCEEILLDVEEVLDEIEDEELAETVQACRTAIDTFRAGFVGPAQSHLGTTLTDLAYRFFGDEEFKGVRAHFENVNPRDDVGMTHFALYATGLGWVRVSVWIKNAGNDFNRHKTLHRLGDHHSTDQFLSALLLITSLSRELERAAGRGELGERSTGRLIAA